MQILERFNTIRSSILLVKLKKDFAAGQNIWGVSSLKLHVGKKGWRTAPGRIII
jgi:hypothetical protein